MEDTTDPVADARWRAVVARISTTSHPVPTAEGWGYVSPLAHKIFWELGPHRVSIEADGYIFKGVGDGWPAKHGYTLGDFEGVLIELEDAGAITFEDVPSHYTDGGACRAYFIRYIGIEQVYLNDIQAQSAIPASLVGVSATRRKRLQREHLVARFAATCVYCKRAGTPELDPDGRTWHGDHVWARSQGGKGGIVLACANCNIRKHNMAATEFMAKLDAERAAVNG